MQLGDSPKKFHALRSFIGAFVDLNFRILGGVFGNSLSYSPNSGASSLSRGMSQPDHTDGIHKAVLIGDGSVLTSLVHASALLIKCSIEGHAAQ
jgi:hypothetical protein